MIRVIDGIDDKTIGKDIAIDARGRILITGEATTAGTTEMVVWRLTEEGDLDTSFDLRQANAAGGSGSDSGRAILPIRGGFLVAGYGLDLDGKYDDVIWWYPGIPRLGH